MSKELLLMQEVITVYHPIFRDDPDFAKKALEHYYMFNTESLIEESLAAIGPYTFINAAHCDFSDGSDSKTASVYPKLNKKSRSMYSGAIKNVVSSYGTLKIGALRVIIYNPIKNRLDYYFLPASFWQTLKMSSNGNNTKKLDFSYNSKKDYIPKFADYQVKSFVDLALAM